MTIVQNLDTWHLTMISQYSVLLFLTVLPSTWLSLAAQFTRVLKKQTPKPFGKHEIIETIYQKLHLLTVMMWMMSSCWLWWCERWHDVIFCVGWCRAGCSLMADSGSNPRSRLSLPLYHRWPLCNVHVLWFLTLLFLKKICVFNKWQCNYGYLTR